MKVISINEPVTYDTVVFNDLGQKRRFIRYDTGEWYGYAGQKLDIDPFALEAAYQDYKAKESK